MTAAVRCRKASKCFWRKGKGSKKGWKVCYKLQAG